MMTSYLVYFDTRHNDSAAIKILCFVFSTCLNWQRSHISIATHFNSFSAPMMMIKTTKPISHSPRNATQRAPTKMFLSFFDQTSTKTQKRTALKEELLQSLTGLARGANASEADKQQVEKLASALEKQNPTKNVLGSELSARWKLLYTTSDSILGTNRPPFLRPFGDIYQTIRVESLTARNQESFPFFNAVEAELLPQSKSTVKVQFKTFFIGSIIPITAPPSAQGELTITYLDEDLRVSRGNKGNLFILKRT